MAKKAYVKKIILVLSLVLLAGILASITSFFIVYRNEIKTISSMKKIDEYGMYEMTYYGDYGFDKLLQTGAKDEKELSDFIVNNLSKCFPADDVLKISLTNGGCTAFAVRNDKNEFIYGRNFDFRYSPSLLLHTNPKNRYASVSTVNLTCLGFSIDNLPKVVNDKDFNILKGCLTLAAPFLPFDGMNEKGVVISLLSVPEGDSGFNADKVTLNTTTAIRLVLDYAADVEDAVNLLSKYNLYFSDNAPCHYLIADSTGDSVLVEFIDKEMKIVYPTSNYQIAANFIAYNDMNKGSGQERYKIVEEEIISRGHILPDEEALNLLAKVGDRDSSGDRLQWSVLYNTTQLYGEIFAHRKVGDRTFFTLENNR